MGLTRNGIRFFAFAHKIGAHIVTVEPELNQLDYIESLAKKYDMEVAIHNHPSPCIYASAEVVEKALKGRSPLMGVCADIGHWKRVGEDPLKNLQKLSGRIKVAHLKDLTDKMEDATWGTGILPVKAFVNELKRFSIFNGLSPLNTMISNPVSKRYATAWNSYGNTLNRSIRFPLKHLYRRRPTRIYV